MNLKNDIAEIYISHVFFFFYRENKSIQNTYKNLMCLRIFRIFSFFKTVFVDL